ncbi:T-cell receptor alpha chain V region CTL-F3 [Takifugu flavidus]|nr:T-cell receptor alpha chain V region CTL-F3 [Takifugu flavidus]
MAAEDQTVTLDCHYTSTVTDVYIFWYKQDGTSRPQFILSRFTIGKGKTEDEFKERFSSTLNPTMKSAPLKIQELQLSDSAVYYCALRPTVTGSSRKCRGEDKVMQPPEDVVAAEGDTVTLDCTFQTSDRNPYLFWYKQDGTSRPQFILSRVTIAPLKIQELQLSDSAVYYCALRPTVTGSSRSAH